MSMKIALSAVMTSLIFAPSAMAQVNPVDPFEARTYGADPFAPRIYGSTAVVRAVQPAATVPTSSVNRVVKPVTQDIQSTITAPLSYSGTSYSGTSYSDTGVVKAQHFKQGDLSPQAYQALLDEADAVRSYQSNANAYTGISYEAAAPVTSSFIEPAQDYQIELFAPETVASEQIGVSDLYGSDPVVSYATTTVVEPVAATLSTHVVRKGDTLYNISKRYAISVDELRGLNGLSGHNIGLGQELSIPSSVHSATFVTSSAPIAQSVPVTASRSVTLVRNVEPVPGRSSIYAVLPKDTLYSISRRTCVSVGDLISTNGIANPNSLQPGQKLNMPAGHCLN